MNETKEITFSVKSGRTVCEKCPFHNIGECNYITDTLGLDCDKFDLTTLKKGNN